MEWWDILRIVALIGLVMGGWNAFKNLPPSVKYQGKRYFRHEDGMFRRWSGRRVKDVVLIAELERLWATRVLAKS